MSLWWSTILIVGSLLSATLAFIWVALNIGRALSREKERNKDKQNIASANKNEVEHIFTDEFKEELRDRGRIHFEKIINDNAKLLQQDLRSTASQINKFTEQDITKTLKKTFVDYEKSIVQAKQATLDILQKTQESVEEQRRLMDEQLRTEIEKEKERIIEQFNENLSKIVNYYVIEAVGSQISIDDQMEFILSELEKNKKQILEDIKSSY